MLLLELLLLLDDDEVLVELFCMPSRSAAVLFLIMGVLTVLGLLSSPPSISSKLLDRLSDSGVLLEAGPGEDMLDVEGVFLGIRGILPKVEVMPPGFSLFCASSFIFRAISLILCFSSGFTSSRIPSGRNLLLDFW